MTVTRTIDLSDITPDELADLFAHMDDKEQAGFFAALRPIAQQWDGIGASWCVQANWIIRALDGDGMFIVETLASHLPVETLERLAKEAAA